MSINEKLSLQDLVDLLAEKQRMTKKDADLFIRELINLITETISQKDFVRIKKFGTFKLTEIKARKSIDVNTNQTIEIPAHYRLSFTPDRELRDGVNRPFSHFKSELINEGAPLEDEAETPIVISDMIINDNIKAEPQDQPLDTTEVKDELEEDTESTVNDIITSITEEIPEEETTPSLITENTDKENIEDSKDEEEAEENDDNEVEEKKKNTFKPILIICLLALIGFGIYWWYPNRVQPTESMITEETTPKNDTEDSNSATIQPDSIASADQPKQEVSQEEYVYEEIEIRYGDTMRNLGRRHYGHKSFWVYIYEENKEVIKDPNSVPIGTPLRIAPPEKYGINVKDTASLRKAVELERVLFKKLGLQ